METKRRAAHLTREVWVKLWLPECDEVWYSAMVTYQVFHTFGIEKHKALSQRRIKFNYHQHLN